MKRCPYCAEKIQDEAIFCRYCGHDTRVPPPAAGILVPGGEPLPAPRLPAREPSLSTGRLAAVVLGLLGILWIGSFALLWTAGSLAQVRGALFEAGVFQLVYRVLIGVCALKEYSRRSSVPVWKRAALFLLALVPLASLIPSWYASRTLVRSHLLGAFLIFDSAAAASVLAIIILLTVHLPQAEVVAVPRTTALPTTIAHAAPAAPWTPTATPFSLATPQGTAPTIAVSPAACLAPSQVRAADQGRTVQVCGRIATEGKQDCPACAFGQYSYLTLEGGFMILSYDWIFESGWIGNCVRVSDVVQLLGGRPVFVYKAGEGYAGSKCAISPDGSETCTSGSYWQWYDCPLEGAT